MACSSSACSEKEAKDHRRVVEAAQYRENGGGTACAGGIVTADELRKNGAKAAWLKIRQIDPSACIHRLLALEGAIEGVQKSLLPGAVKADLKAFYQQHKM